MKLKSINPYNNEVLEEFDEFSSSKINTLIGYAGNAFELWRKSGIAGRSVLLNKAADILKDEKDIFSRSITLEMGKPIKESISEVEKCAWVCEHYARDAEVLLQREAVATDADLSLVVYEPLGTILGIMPWNFPFWQAFRFAVPALMAGNTVLLKHASNVQRCALHIESIFIKAGLPEGVFQNLTLSSKNIGQVIENDNIKGISLTGSDTAGSKVAEAAGRMIRKTVLELGGSNAFIVLDDANLIKAAKTGVKARLQNSGQSCIAAKRFILKRGIANEFIQLISEEIAHLKAGDPLNPSTDIGPLATVDQADKVRLQIERSVEMGAEVLAGGKQNGAFIEPAILVNVKPGMPVFDDEVFGPVFSIITAGSDEEAIALSNQSKYGLGVSLFTNDMQKAKRMIPEFNEGSVFINDLVKSDPRLPFGGVKRSGYGRELAVNGIREFVNIKTVFIREFSEAGGDYDDQADVKKNIGPR